MGMKNSMVLLYDLLSPPRCGLCGEPLIGITPQRSTLCAACVKKIEDLRLSKTDRRCRVCGTPLISEHDICLRCRERTYAFDSHLSVFFYRDAVQTLIRAYKFHGNRSLAPLFAEYAALSALEFGFEGVPIVPSPPGKRKMRRKGWEHVHEICRILKRKYGFTILHLLEKERGGEQKNFDFNGRIENIRGSISSRKISDPPERVLFFDDVFTTGATCHECAIKLKEIGIHRVDGLSIAMD